MALGKIVAAGDEELTEIPTEITEGFWSNTLLGADENDHYSLHEFEMEPGGIIEAHAHTAHHEGVYVVSGTVKLQIGQQAVEAGPGYFGWGPDNVILEVENVGDERAKCLAIFGPPYDPNADESDRTVPVNQFEPPREE